MQKPHVHAELIKAWADGAEIEYLDDVDETWYTSETPSWSPHFKYRIKPESKSLGQIAYEAYIKENDASADIESNDYGWKQAGNNWKKAWEAAAQAVIKEAKERE